MSFVYTVNPNGGVVYRRAVEVPFSKSHLLERILSAENINRAWKQVRANKGAPGIDGVTVEQFPDIFRELWPQIRSNLFEGTYAPSPVLRVEIPKPDGSKRPLGIPTVILVKRPVRTRMQGVVGAGGLKPPATRLNFCSLI